MTQVAEIHAYLSQLRLYLARLQPREADEVIQEIESHLFDVLEQQPQADVAALLAGFGEPRALAAQYIAHIEQGAPPPAGFKVIRRVQQGVSWTLYWSMAVLGGCWCGLWLLILVLKLAQPDLVGAWANTGNESFHLGYLDAPPASEAELFGYWLLPIAAGMALAGGWITRQVLRVLKQAQR